MTEVYDYIQNVFQQIFKNINFNFDEKLPIAVTTRNQNIDIHNVQDGYEKCDTVKFYNPYELNDFVKEYLFSEVGLEILVRLILVSVAIYIYKMKAFDRAIPPEEWWRYKNPSQPRVLISVFLFVCTLALPMVVLIVFYSIFGNEKDLRHGLFALTLAISLNSVFTALIKIMVGRPRPNFFYRCYPDGIKASKCTGDPKVIEEGRKSFPSGHSSFAFTLMTFLTLYLSGKLNVFNMYGRGQSWRICTCIMPSLIATGMSIYRTCNYRHHWEDIVVGAMIGIILGYICYRQHFPSVFDYNPSEPYNFLN